MIDPLSLEKNAHNRQNFLSLIDRVIFQKWHTEITLVINKEFSLTEIALIDSGANMNCIQEGLIPLKYYEKSSERLTQANGEKFIINYKIPNVHICNDGTMLSQYEWTNSLIDVPNKIIINNIFTPFIVSLNAHIIDVLLKAILIKEALTGIPLLIIKENINCCNFLNKDRFNFLTKRVNYESLTDFPIIIIDKRLYGEALFS